jgi:acetylornithine deacetylase/succinyl-diaminopimelate desuccinylase-like protein
MPEMNDAQAARIDDWLALQAVPSPTFGEAARMQALRARLEGLGFAPQDDEAGNVLVTVSNEAPRWLVLTHVDTVFSEADQRPVERIDAQHWSAPGLGDNTASLAVVLSVLRRIRAGALKPAGGWAFGFTVGEEGFGDLKGARALLGGLESKPRGVLAVDGYLGSVVLHAVGSARYRVELSASGGHAWGDRGGPTAVHAAGDLIHAWQRIPRRGDHGGSVNVGRVEGGHAVNALALHASLDVEVRALEPGLLARYDREVTKRAQSVGRRHGVKVNVEPRGLRPAGRLDDGRFDRAFREAFAAHGLTPRAAPSSTDANAALEFDVPAATLGVYRGGHAHRLDEWVDPTSLSEGADLLERVLTTLDRQAGPG